MISFNVIICFGQNNDAIPPPPPPYNSNDSSIVDDRIWTKVEQEAQFPRGNEGWRNFLIKNLQSNKIAKFIHIPDSVGTVFHKVLLKFVVSKDGTINDITVESSTNDYCSTEAIRVIKLSPKWIPAYQNGRDVNAYRIQPLTFAFAK
jgi:protein TonB